MAYNKIKQNYSNIADAIRSKTGKTNSMTAEEMPTEIEGIEIGITPTGNKPITTTAKVDVTEFATAQVSDANLVAANIKKDVSILGVVGTNEGYPEPTEKAPTITENGENINIKDYASVDVAVPQPSGELEPESYEFSRDSETTFDVTDYESIRIPSVSSMCYDTYYVSNSSGSGYNEYNVAGYEYVRVDWPSVSDLCDGTQDITIHDGDDISNINVAGYEYVALRVDSDVEVDESITVTIGDKSYRLTRLS